MIFDSQEQKDIILRMFNATSWAGAEIDKAAAFKRSIEAGVALSLDQQNELAKVLNQPDVEAK